MHLLLHVSHKKAHFPSSIQRHWVSLWFEESITLLLPSWAESGNRQIYWDFTPALFLVHRGPSVLWLENRFCSRFYICAYCVVFWIGPSLSRSLEILEGKNPRKLSICIQDSLWILTYLFNLLAAIYFLESSYRCFGILFSIFYCNQWERKTLTAHCVLAANRGLSMEYVWNLLRCLSTKQ